MASTKETFLQFLRSKGHNVKDIGTAFKMADGSIVFFPFDEEFDDRIDVGSIIVSCSYALSNNLTHKFTKKY